MRGPVFFWGFAAQMEEQHAKHDDDDAANEGGGIGDFLCDQNTQNAGQKWGDKHVIADLRSLGSFGKGLGPGYVGNCTGANAKGGQIKELDWGCMGKFLYCGRRKNVYDRRASFKSKTSNRS